MLHKGCYKSDNSVCCEFTALLNFVSFEFIINMAASNPSHICDYMFTTLNTAQ
jgi:hypothetical protein